MLPAFQDVPSALGRLQELMASWKAQPLLLTFGVLLGVAAIGLLHLDPSGRQGRGVIQECEKGV